MEGLVLTMSSWWSCHRYKAVNHVPDTGIMATYWIYVQHILISLSHYLYYALIIFIHIPLQGNHTVCTCTQCGSLSIQYQCILLSEHPSSKLRPLPCVGVVLTYRHHTHFTPYDHMADRENRLPTHRYQVSCAVCSEQNNASQSIVVVPRVALKPGSILLVYY